MNVTCRQCLPLHPGINFSCLEVGGDLGGCVFAASSVLVMVIGLPQARWLVCGGLVAGLPLAWLLAAWNRRHEGAPRRTQPISLGLKDSNPNGRASGQIRHSIERT